MLSSLLKISRNLELLGLLQDRLLLTNVLHHFHFGESKKPRCGEEVCMSTSFCQTLVQASLMRRCTSADGLRGS